MLTPRPNLALLNIAMTSFSITRWWRCPWWVILLASLFASSTGCESGTAEDGPSPRSLAAAAHSQRESLGSHAEQPNIILINLDDADCEAVFSQVDSAGDQTSYLPNIRRLASQGLRLNNLHAAVPICNPSRVCFYTGQYAHKTGVRCNAPLRATSLGTPGGFLPFRHGGPFGDSSRPHISNELGTWMQAAGYDTIHVGKYLHEQFEAQPGENFYEIVPRGWNDFYCSFGASYFRTMFYKNGEYSFCDKADPKKYPERYRGAIERVDIRDLVEKRFQRGEPQPFFLYYAPLAPHSEEAIDADPTETIPDRGMVPNGRQGDLPELRQPRGPDFNIADNSDRPLPIRSIAPLRNGGDTPATNDELASDLDYRRRILSIKSVDDVLGDLFELLERHRAIDNTLIILTSDHGYSLGQLRHIGKSLPYDRITRCPTVAWGPGIVKAAPGTSDHLLSHIDFAPTLLDYAGVSVPDTVQGQSFRSVLQGTAGPSAEWRPQGILVEHWERVHSRPSPIKVAYVSLRLHDRVYTQWYTGEEEYYDLAQDRLQLRNRIGELAPEERKAMRRQLESLREQMPKPELFISTPFFANDVYLREVTLEGLIEYKSPLRDVRLQITKSHGEARRYWDGTAWQAEPQWVSANLASNQSVISGWDYRFTPPLESEQEDFSVTAIGSAEDGTEVVDPPTKKFSVRQNYPLTIVENPDRTTVAKLYQKFNIQGSASDDVRIREVALIIEHPERRAYWNGKQWQADLVELPAQLTSRRDMKVEWTYEFTPTEPEGEVMVTVKVVPVGKVPPRPTLPATPVRWAS